MINGHHDLLAIHTPSLNALLARRAMGRPDDAALRDPMAAAAPYDRAVLKNMQANGHYQLQVVDGVALIGVEGVLQKGFSTEQIYYGGTGMEVVQEQIAQATADPQVKGIVLLIDSPGGTVAGTADLGAAVAAAAAAKPTAAVIQDLGASAAYWIASQTSRIFVNETGLVGSIGTYTTFYDFSRMLDSIGIKAHLITTGKHKGVGAMGVAPTDEQLAEVQRRVHSLNSVFLAAVGRGRKMDEEKVKAVATGQVWVGKEAIELGLADAIGGQAEAMAWIVGAGGAGDREKGEQGSRGAGERGNQLRAAGDAVNTILQEDAMSTPTNQGATPVAPPQAGGQPATMKELKAAFPDMDATWREDVQEKGMTMDQARQHHTDTLRARLQSREEEIQKLKADQPKPAAPGGKGVDPVGQAEETDEAAAGDTATEQFFAGCDELVAKGMSRDKAVRQMMVKHPKLHQRMLAETTAKTKPADSSANIGRGAA